jgi:uncharacterized protein YhaN
VRLARLRVRQFRRFEDAEFTFDPRLNVLVGPNEAGKSTLRHVILTALFVNPATTSKKVAEWRPWGSESPGWIALEFEIDGRRFEVRKDFERRRTELRDLLNGVTWDGPRAQEAILRGVGLSTEGLYRATAMVEQSEIASLRVGAADIGTRLSRIVQAGPGDAEASSVIKHLDKEIAEQERGLDKPAKNPGTIRRLQGETESLGAQLAELQRRIARLDEQRDELRRIRAEHAEAVRELRDKDALLRENQMFLILEGELEPLRAQERQLAERIAAVERGYERLAHTGRDLEALQAQGVPDDDAIARLHAAQGAAQARREEVLRRQHALRTAQTRLEQLAAPAPGRPWTRVAVPGGIALVAAAFGLGVIGVARSAALPLLAALILVVGGVGLILAEARRRRRSVSLRAEREAAVVRLEESQAALGTAGEVLQRQEEALRSVVAATGSATVEEALARHTRLRGLWEDRAAVQGQVEALLSGRPLEGLAEELAQKRADIARREAALSRPEAQTKRLTQLQVQQLEHDVADLTERVHRLRARQDHLERMTAEGAPDFEVLVLLQERLAEVQEMLEATRRRNRVYRAVREGLQTARQQTLIPARRLVEERAGEYLGLLTMGAYDKVKVEEPPLRVSVWVPQAGDWLEPAEPELSRGTADQVYLAVRLALVEVLADEGRHPPLLLDDPFATFDPERLRAAMALLRRVGEANQILLFTCRPDYEAFGDRVIAVGEHAPEPPDIPGPLWQPPPQTH